MNVQHRIMYSVNFKKDWEKRIYPSKFCGSLVLKSIKRSVINIDGFVKSLKIAILPISYLINSVSYKVGLGIFWLFTSSSIFNVRCLQSASGGLDVRCSTFNLFTVLARRNLIGSFIQGVSPAAGRFDGQRLNPEPMNLEPVIAYITFIKSKFNIPVL